MKKTLLFLLCFLSIPSLAQTIEEKAVFDFSNPTSLNPSVTPNDEYDGASVSVLATQFIDNGVTISFQQGPTPAGVIIKTRLSDDEKSYSLCVRQTTTMTVAAPKGCLLKSVTFSGYLGDMKKQSGQEGKWSNGVWDADGKDVSEVVFQDNTTASAVTKVEVVYTRTSTPLTLKSADPGTGSTLRSFRSMTLQFNTKVSEVVSTDGILLSCPGNKTMRLTPSAAGKTVTLSIDSWESDVAVYGQYNVIVPAGAFKNSEGSVNDAINCQFNIDPIRTTLSYMYVSPAEDTYTELERDIILSFDQDVTLNEDVKGKMYKDGNLRYPVTLTTPVDGDQTKVKLTSSHEANITEAGNWRIDIPEGAIHNAFLGDVGEDRWNAEFSLNYTINSRVDAMKEEARNLLKNKGLGYPASDSDGRTALTNALAAEDATEESLTEAIGQFLAETNVTMPTTGKWYTIAGVNSKGQKIYLTLSDDGSRVGVSKSEFDRAAFKASVSEGTVVFETKDGKFLHVPTTLPLYDKTTDSNLTDTQSDVNNLTLAKFPIGEVEGVDPVSLLGRFTMNGLLGSKNGGEERTAYALLNHGSVTISTDPDTGLRFDENLSSAFVLAETSEPSGDLQIVEPSIGLRPGYELEHAGDDLTLVVYNVDQAILKDDSKPYFNDSEAKKVEFEGKILQPIDGSFYTFNVNTAGLAKGIYLLVIPTGTFEYSAKNAEVMDVEMSVTVNILASGSDPGQGDLETVTPVAALNIASLKAGEPLTLTIREVDGATIANAAKPYYTKSGKKVSFSGNILKATSKATQFAVNTTGLEAGDYKLKLPVGTFTYTKEGKNVEDVEMEVAFTIVASGSDSGQGDLETVTPVAALSIASLKAGESLTLTIQEVDGATIANAAKPYYTKSGKKVSFSGNILKATSKATQFAVNTTGLEAGDYKLKLPVGTFTYTKEGKNVEDVEMEVAFTIVASGGGSEKDFIYSYSGVIEYGAKSASDPFKDVDLNELILYHNIGNPHSGLVPDPKKTVKLVLQDDVSVVVGTGHFESYPDFTKDHPGTQAIKLVLNEKIKSGDLDKKTGIYAYVMEAATFGDANFGKYLKGESYEGKCYVNSEGFSIIRYVNNKEAAKNRPSYYVLEEAESLLRMTGLGYPTATSAARLSLANKVVSNEGTDDEFRAEMQKFYAETDVEKPVNESYYKVYSQSSDGTRHYLTYDGRVIGLTKESAKATGFQLLKNGDGTYQFVTGDGKYLRQLSAEDNTSMSYTAASNAVTVSKLTVQDVDVEKTFGLFSLLVENTYALVDVKNAKLESANQTNSFTAEKTCGFMFEEIPNLKSVPAPALTATLDPEDGAEVENLSTVTVTFSVDMVELVNKDLIKLTDQEFKDKSPASISRVEGKPNEWAILFKDVANNQKYRLNIDRGAFTYTFADNTTEIPQMTATYIVQDRRASDAQKQEVKRLLALTGVGYPAADNAARKALENLPANGSETEYQTALDAYYAETDVELPETDKYYKVIAVTSSGSKAYLTYDGQHVGLTTDASKATGLKLVLESKKYRFVTGDGKYLAQLSDDPTTEKGSGNVVGISRLIVSGMDNSKTFGILSLKVGKTYAQVDVKNAKALAGTSSLTVFDEKKTNGFLFETISNTDIPAPEMVAEVSPVSGTEIDDYFTQVTISFVGTQVVALADKSKVTLVPAKGSKLAPSSIKKTKDNEYAINFKDVPLGQTYTLKVDDGAFSFTFAERTVSVKGLTATYTVIDFRPTTEQVAQAESLLKMSGVGYPKADSKARTTLAGLLTDRNTRAEQVTAAIEAFMSDTDVELPETGKYYKVVAVTSSGSKAYLTYDGKNIGVTTNASKATGLKLVLESKKYRFVTGDGKYLAQLSDEPMTEKGSGNVVGISRLIVSGVDNSKTFGILSLKVGKTYAQVDVKNAKALAGTESLTVFDEKKTNGFLFETISNTDIPAPEMAAEVSPVSGTEIDDYFTQVTVSFVGTQVVALADKSKVTLVPVRGSKLAPSSIKKTKYNEYAINFKDVPLGETYTLYVDDGAFSYTFAERAIPVKGLTATYTVIDFHPTTEQMAQAESLLKMSGVGYPKADSKARTTLEGLFNDRDARTEQMAEAIEAFMSDTDVELPASEKYYSISAIANNGKEVFIKYDGEGISFVNTFEEASAFTIQDKGSGLTAFVAADGSYLTQLTPQSKETATTDKYSKKDNAFVLKRFKIDSSDFSYEKTMGYFSMCDNSGVYTLVDVTDGSIWTNSKHKLEYFDKDWTNAFRFKEKSGPDAGIHDIMMDEADGAVYDLTGRKVTELKSGQLYIRNGKKFVAK